MSYIQDEVEEYTAEMINDALENGEPLKVAADILAQVVDGWLAAMDEQGQIETAVKMIAELRVS